MSTSFLRSGVAILLIPIGCSGAAGGLAGLPDDGAAECRRELGDIPFALYRFS